MNARRLRLQNSIALQTAAATASPKDHLISDLEAFPVREPVSHRSWTAVRVRTTSGLTGWGEAGRVAAEDVAKARAIMVKRSATAWATVRTGTPLDGAIDMALLDISARAASAPVFRLLGGPTRFKVRALAALHGNSDSELAASLANGLKAGFRALQVPLPPASSRNQGQAFHHAVRDRIEKLRAASPPGIDFVLAGSGSIRAGDAAGVAAEAERFHLLWFDEPAAITNLATIRKIADESVTPLGFGRTASEPSVFQDLLREGLADILRPSLHDYGISTIRSIAALAETYYVAVAPNHDGGPIATAAALHLAASLPNFFIQHVPFPLAEEDSRMRSALVRQPVETVRDGFLTLSNSPGLGIDVNEDALRRYREQA